MSPRCFWRQALAVLLAVLPSTTFLSAQTTQPSKPDRSGGSATVTPASPSATTLPRRGRLSAAFESATTQPTRQVKAARFDPSVFQYASDPARLVFWATPTAAQTLMFGRPAPVVGPEQKSLVAANKIQSLPTATTLVNADLRWFTFQDEQGEWIPAMLATPAGKAGPFPLIVATHGIFSHKMQVLGQVGPALLEKGYAVLAVDLPLHGERAGMPLEILDSKNPARMASIWRRAVINIREAIDVVQSAGVADQSKGVTVVGYSLGSWMSTLLGAADPRVHAMVLMVGGATELSAEMMALPEVANSDPRVAIAAFSPRPILMLNARNDRTVTPAMAERLYKAALEPKEQRWYDMGHLLKDPAFKDAADWIAAKWNDEKPQPGSPG